MNRQFVLRSQDNAVALHAFLKANARAMADSGHPLAVTITEYKARRSTEQNKRYWAILGDISRNAYVAGKQFSQDAWAEHFKREFIGIEELPSGKDVGISTTTLNVQEFTDYMTRIECYAVQELGIELEAA